MGSPDVIMKDGAQLDIKTTTVQVKGGVFHTDWTLEIAEPVICWSIRFNRQLNHVIKTTNLIHRLKRKNEKPNFEHYLAMYGIIFGM